MRRLSTALKQYRISGVINNIDFLHTISRHQAFADADFDTGFIGKHEESLLDIASTQSPTSIALAALYLVLVQKQRIHRFATASKDPSSPWNNPYNWRPNQAAEHRFTLKMGDELYPVSVTAQSNADNSAFAIRFADTSYIVNGSLDGRNIKADINGHKVSATVAANQGNYCLFSAEQTLNFSIEGPDLGDNSDNAGENQLVAPMNGTVVSHLVDTGSTVSKGTPLMIMEAMKMEHTIRAPADGVVNVFYFQPGELVSGGAELIQFERTE